MLTKLSLFQLQQVTLDWMTLTKLVDGQDWIKMFERHRLHVLGGCSTPRALPCLVDNAGAS